MLCRSIAVAGGLLLACGPEKQGGSTASSDSASSGNTGSSTDVTTSEAGCQFVPSAEDIQCVSARQMQALLYIPSYSSISGPIDELCTVAAVTDDGELQTLSLDCAATLDIFLTTTAPHVRAPPRSRRGSPPTAGESARARRRRWPARASPRPDRESAP